MPLQDQPIRVLFVCLGNICRSPMAEAVFRQLVEQAGLAERFEIASMGTGNWHVGERPHVGTRTVLKKHRIDPGGKRAMALSASAMQTYDYIIAMDRDNADDIQAAYARRVPRLLDFANHPPTLDVPDPYYTGNFDQVYDLVLAGSQGLLQHICQLEGL